MEGQNTKGWMEGQRLDGETDGRKEEGWMRDGGRMESWMRDGGLRDRGPPKLFQEPQITPVYVIRLKPSKHGAAHRKLRKEASNQETKPRKKSKSHRKSTGRSTVENRGAL
jgi:hypothetical protein